MRTRPIILFLLLIFHGAAGAETIFYDHFDDGMLDPAWEVTFDWDVACGWTYAEEQSELHVTEICHGGEGWQWADVTLRQECTLSGDFYIEFQMAWDSHGDPETRQRLVLILFDSTGNRIIEVGYRDFFLYGNGEQWAYVYGNDEWWSGLPGTGAATIVVRRGVEAADHVMIEWNGNTILEASAMHSIASVGIRFGYMKYSDHDVIIDESVDLILCLDESGIPPCVVECPTGSEFEGEPALVDGYIDTHNCGCDGLPTGDTIFQILLGDGTGRLDFCGLSGWYVDTQDNLVRDTDWYECYVGESGVVTITAEAEYQTYIFEAAAGDCENIHWLQWTGFSCYPGTMTIYGDPGQAIWLWIGPDSSGPPDSWGGEEYEYLITFEGIAGDVSAVPDDSSAPRAFAFNGAHPNPFNPQTTITFSLNRDGRVELVVYDLLGRLVRILANRIYPTGDHSIVWNGKDAAGRAMPSGSYVVRLETESNVESRKVSLIR